MVLRATGIVRAADVAATPWEIVVLDAGERHLRRRRITLQHGDEVMVDLAHTVKLADRDCLVLEDGRLVEVIAADEDLIEVRARDAAHLVQLAWHIGNRHLEAQIEDTRILIRPDHVIHAMLEQLGARLGEVREPFAPEHGAYSHAHAPAPPGGFSLEP
ncbi:MAG: urease accessory protein UreE [Rhizobiales bacterium]|nr:urease accessory protein UreE [Hyphomicrobiales bacterium]